MYTNTAVRGQLAGVVLSFNNVCPQNYTRVVMLGVRHSYVPCHFTGPKIPTLKARSSKVCNSKTLKMCLMGMYPGGHHSVSVIGSFLVLVLVRNSGLTLMPQLTL